MSNLKSEYHNFIKTSNSNINTSAFDKIILSKSKKIITPSNLYITIKYTLLFFASIFLSLLVCPQFGLGLRNKYPLFHYFFHKNQIICAIYCAITFFLSTHLLVYIGLNHFEKIALHKKNPLTPVMAFALSFGGFMFFSNNTMKLNLSFILVWSTFVLGSYLAFHQLSLKKLTQDKVINIS